jgi:hypothetical protein
MCVAELAAKNQEGEQQLLAVPGKLCSERA